MLQFDKMKNYDFCNYSLSYVSVISDILKKLNKKIKPSKHAKFILLFESSVSLGTDTFKTEFTQKNGR